MNLKEKIKQLKKQNKENVKLLEQLQREVDGYVQIDEANKKLKKQGYRLKVTGNRVEAVKI